MCALVAAGRAGPLPGPKAACTESSGDGVGLSSGPPVVCGGTEGHKWGRLIPGHLDDMLIHAIPRPTEYVSSGLAARGREVAYSGSSSPGHAALRLWEVYALAPLVPVTASLLHFTSSSLGSRILCG